MVTAYCVFHDLCESKERSCTGGWGEETEILLTIMNIQSGTATLRQIQDVLYFCFDAKSMLLKKYILFHKDVLVCKPI